MRKNKRMLSTAVIAAVLVTGGAVGISATSDRAGAIGEGIPITVYKSPSCGCCTGWVAHLRKEGFEVTTDMTRDMDEVKRSFGVPSKVESCHTAVIGDQVVEGHVPAEVIRMLIDEAPEVAGIALPGMPDGSPGMPGRKIGTWEILSFDDYGSLALFTEY